MTSWCSTRRWWSTASFFPVVFGNSLSQKIHGTWSSRFESSFTGCSGKAKTSKPCCVWISETEEKIISKYSSTRNYMLINLPLSAMLITRLSPGTSIFEKRHFISLNTTLFLNSPCSFPPVPATPCDSYPCPGFAPIFELETELTCSFEVNFNHILQVQEKFWIDSTVGSCYLSLFSF